MRDFSATQIVVELVDQTIDVESIWQQLSNIDAGAHSVFLGKTRRQTNDKQTLFLVYDAYRPMAILELRRLADVAARRWDLKALVLIHLLGRVDLDQASIAIGASAAHRADVFAAIPWLMDEIKTSVPIWKQENWVGGESNWVHP